MKQTRIYTTRNRKTRAKRRVLFISMLLIIIISLIALISSCGKKDKDTNKDKDVVTTTTTTTMAQTTTTKPPKDDNKETTKPNSSNDKNNQANGFNYSKPVSKSDAVDNTFFDDAIFIGDSRSEGFMVYTGLSNATFYTHKGLMVNTAFTSPVINLGGKKVSVMDAVKSNKKFKKAYIMLGLNELGWAYSNLYVEKYGSIIDTIKKVNPNAQIYIQSLIPVTSKKSSSDKIHNNKKIREYNTLLQQLAAEKKVYYVNVAEGLVESNGCIPEDAAYDGIHLKKPYCLKWLEYLKTHTVK